MTDDCKRTCYRCRKPQFLTAFVQRRDGRYYDMCRKCVAAILSRPRQAKGPRKRQRPDESNRTCYLCNRFLPVEQFTRRSDGSYFSACKDPNRLVFAQRRRARLLAAEGEFTQKEWQDILAKYPRCPRCHRDWDSIPIPKSRRSSITVDPFRHFLKVVAMMRATFNRCAIPAILRRAIDRVESTKPSAITRGH